MKKTYRANGTAENRRSFLKKSMAVGTTSLIPMAGLVTGTKTVFGQNLASSAGKVTAGDLAVLKFLAAAELVEDAYGNSIASWP